MKKRNIKAKRGRKVVKYNSVEERKRETWEKKIRGKMWCERKIKWQNKEKEM